MRRLYLINPPERVGYSNERSLSGGLGVSRKLKFWEKSQLLLPPPDMLLTAAVAEKCDVPVEIIDLMLDRHFDEAAAEYTQARIEKTSGPDDERFVAVRLSMPTLLADLQFADRLKSRMPNMRLILFGSVIMTTLDHWIRDTKADALLYGEPEALIGALLRSKGDAWKRQRGVILPGAFIPLVGVGLYDGSQQHRFAEWVQNNELTELPFPAYHLVPMERYSPTGETKDCEVYVTASRGCPIGCTMCPYMLHEGRPLRTSAAERVLAEMEWLNNKWGITRWRFRDPNFGFDRKLAREILEQVISRGIKMEATVEGSLECMDDALIELMGKAGVRVITTGIETADMECLRSIGQKIKVNDILERKIKYADSLGIHVYGTFVIGAPEESWDTVEHTIRYAQTIPCESGFTVMTPFPGTPMYYRALEEGLLDKEMTYARWNSYEATVRSRFLSREDLTLARLWARLELIIPYRRYQARQSGPAERVKTEIKLLPRSMALLVVRGLVFWRRAYRKSKVIAPMDAGQTVIHKTPLHWQ